MKLKFWSAKGLIINKVHSFHKQVQNTTSSTRAIISLNDTGLIVWYLLGYPYLKN